MAKETYYFSHDFHARNDRKMKRLLLKEKVSGIGIYWCLVEMLHEEGGYILMSEIDVIAQEFRISTEKLEKIIKNYELFKFDDNKFWSSSALHRIDRKNEKSIKARQSANYRHSNDANAQRTHNERITNAEQTDSERDAIKGKERKGKEKEIEKNEGLPPHPPPDEVNGFNYLPDGRSYIERTMFFTASDFEGIPDEKNKSIRSLILTVKGVQLSAEDINNLWESFKGLALTFQKPYRNEDDVYNHFANWCKGQPFGGKKATKTKENNLPVVGVEFIEDFTKCKMSDGSVRALSANETAMAKYQGFKPNSIK